MHLCPAAPTQGQTTTSRPSILLHPVAMRPVGSGGEGGTGITPIALSLPLFHQLLNLDLRAASRQPGNQGMGGDEGGTVAVQHQVQVEPGVAETSNE